MSEAKKAMEAAAKVPESKKKMKIAATVTARKPVKEKPELTKIQPAEVKAQSIAKAMSATKPVDKAASIQKPLKTKPPKVHQRHLFQKRYIPKKKAMSVQPAPGLEPAEDKATPITVTQETNPVLQQITPTVTPRADNVALAQATQEAIPITDTINAGGNPATAPALSMPVTEKTTAEVNTACSATTIRNASYNKCNAC